MLIWLAIQLLSAFASRLALIRASIGLVCFRANQSVFCLSAVALLVKHGLCRFWTCVALVKVSKRVP